MAKKSFKLVKASAALAVTAAALTPVMAAEASTAKAVELKAEVVLGGKFKEALALNTPAGVQITWGKHLVTAINKWQTVTGKGSDGKTYIKKLYARNYPLYVLDQDLGEVEAGSELVKPSIRVMYRDGKVYTQAPERFTMSSNYNTKDLGEQKVLISYNHNGNRITKLLTYTVVAGEVEFENVSSSVNQATEVLSVNADVKNLKEGEKVELVVYAGRDVNAPLTPVQAEVKDGKVSVKSAKLPAGDHSFILRSGDVKTEAVNFTVEAPMVKSAEAINASQIELKFNKAVDKTSVETASNYSFDGVTFAGQAVLKDDTTVVLSFGASQVGKAYKLTTANLKTKDLRDVANFSGVVAVSDSVAPAVKELKFATNGDLQIHFSEPLGATTPIVRVNNVPVTASSVAAGDTYVTVTAANLNSANIKVDTSVPVYVAGAKDLANNTMSIFNGSVVKVSDTTKPSIASITQLGQNKVRVVFSEALGADAYDLQIGELKFLKGSSLIESTAVLKNTVLDSTGKTYDVTFEEASIYTAGVDSSYVTLLLAKDAVKDVAGNGIDQFTQSFTFTADKTAPKFVSSALSTNRQTVELKFDEELSSAIATGKFIVTDAQGVRYNVQGASLKSGDDKVLVLDFVAGAAEIANGEYTIQVQAGAVKDARNNESAAFTTSIKVGSTADTTKPVASLLGTSAPNKFVVNFNEEVTSSALSLSNYTLDGRSLPVGTVIYFNDADKETVTIELPENSINIGNVSAGTAAILAVSGVADLAGNVVDATNFNVLIADNTPAVLQSAQKLGNTLVLTFNENLGSSANDALITELLSNYEIKSGSVTVVQGTSTGSAKAELVAGSANKVQITFTDVAGTGYNAAHTVTVKTLSGGDATDVNGLAIKSGVLVTAN